MHRVSLRPLRAAAVALPCVLLALLAAPSEAQAAGQTTLANPPKELAPGKTRTNHEIGASTNASAAGPSAFIPAFDWRVHFPQTGRIGQLSGLFLGVNVGPAIGFGGGVSGMSGLSLGYEIDPWSNLALTFSPVLHNDFYFNENYFEFAQTFGPAVRLYVNQNWVVYFEPGSFGWNLWTNGDDVAAGFTYRGGAGFAYKF